MVQKPESQSTKKENQGTKDRKSKYKQERIRVQKIESQSTNKRESGYKSQKVKVQTIKIYGTKMRSQGTHIKIITRALQ